MAVRHQQWKHHDMNLGRNHQVKCARIPFTQNATEVKTGFQLPPRAIVTDIAIQVVTNVGGSTISVGTYSGTTGTAAGFVNSTSCATAGFVPLVSGSATTLGAFLNAADQSGSTTRLNKGLIESEEHNVTYTTSAHAVTGYIYLFYTDVTNPANANDQ